MHALAASPELADPVEQTLSVANARDVGVGDEVNAVRHVQRRCRRQIQLAARVDHDVLELLRQEAKHLFDGARLRTGWTVEMIGAGENLETGLVLDDQLLEKPAVETVKVVDRVEQAISAPYAKEKRDLAESGFQIDNHRGALAQARQLHGAIHRNGRRAGTALAPTKAIVVAWAASPTTRFAGTSPDGWLPGTTCRRAATPGTRWRPNASPEG